MDVQEFHIDLKPHHLQGHSSGDGEDKRQVARVVSLVDHGGRSQGDEDYGDALPRDHRPQDVAEDVREAKASGTSRSIGSTFIGDGGERG